MKEVKARRLIGPISNVAFSSIVQEYQTGKRPRKSRTVISPEKVLETSSGDIVLSMIYSFSHMYDISLVADTIHSANMGMICTDMDSLKVFYFN